MNVPIESKVPPVQPAPVERVVLGRALGGGGVDHAIALATADPRCRVTLLEPTWAAVDRSRERIAAWFGGGDHAAWLHDRITVRHAAVRRWLQAPGLALVA